MLSLTHKSLCSQFRRWNPSFALCHTMHEASWTSALLQHHSQPQHHFILRLFQDHLFSKTTENAIIQNIFSHSLEGEIPQMQRCTCCKVEVCCTRRRHKLQFLMSVLMVGTCSNGHWHWFVPVKVNVSIKVTGVFLWAPKGS